ncbi:MAG: hypothetical protein AAGI06_08365, partial [Pseudomonadota bacterium]
MTGPGKDNLDLAAQMVDRIPVAVQSGVSAIIAAPGAEPEVFDAKSALDQLSRGPHLICHAGFLVRRLAFVCEAGQAMQRSCLEQRHLDLAELCAFVMPAKFALPTPLGLARALGFHAQFTGRES